MQSKERHREYNLQYYKNKRAALIQELGGKCAICGSTENLEFDHIISANKQYPIAKLITQSPIRLHQELEKCQLLCKACHIKKSKLCKDGSTKLDVNTILDVRKLYANTDKNQKEICDLFGLKETTVSSILRGVHWKDVTADDGLQGKIDIKRANRHASARPSGNSTRQTSSIEVDKLDITTGDVVCTYPSMRAAAKDGFKPNHIAECCRGEAKSHGGYVWRLHE